MVISNENSVFTQIGFDNAVARDTPVFARFRDSGEVVAGQGRHYRVSDFNHGLDAAGARQDAATFATDVDDGAARAHAGAPRRRRSARCRRSREWVNVRDLGVKGDGKTDDTAALQRRSTPTACSICRCGCYASRDTLRLRPDTRADRAASRPDPARSARRRPRPSGRRRAEGADRERRAAATTIVSGLGLFTGGINPRATACCGWRARTRWSTTSRSRRRRHASLPARAARSAFAAAIRVAGAGTRQYPSIWVTDGGGGTFATSGRPNTFARRASTSPTPRRRATSTSCPPSTYRNEIVLDRVENWEFLAPQTEEEVARRRRTRSRLEIRNSSNILFANYHGYRVTRSDQAGSRGGAAVQLERHPLPQRPRERRERLRHCDDNGCGTYTCARASTRTRTRSGHDAAACEVREREFARLDVPAASGSARAAASRVARRSRSSPTASIRSPAARSTPPARSTSSTGIFHRIHGWSQRRRPVDRRATRRSIRSTWRSTDRATCWCCPRPGTKRTVYSIDPARPGRRCTCIAPTPRAAARRRGGGAARSTSGPTASSRTSSIPTPTSSRRWPRCSRATWRAPKPQEYVSPDGSLVLPAFRVSSQGPRRSSAAGAGPTRSTPTASSPRSRASACCSTNGSENRDLQRAGRRRRQRSPTSRVFAERGGESVARDAGGNVYVANGQVFVYAPDGKPIGRIDVPERPLQLLFGGADRRTLFILTHHTLYAVTI